MRAHILPRAPKRSSNGLEGAIGHGQAHGPLRVGAHSLVRWQPGQRFHECPSAAALQPPMHKRIVDWRAVVRAAGHTFGMVFMNGTRPASAVRTLSRLRRNRKLPI